MSIDKLKMLYGNRVKEYGNEIYILDDIELLLDTERVRLGNKVIDGYRDLLVMKDNKSYATKHYILNVKTGAILCVGQYKMYNDIVISYTDINVIIYNMMLKEKQRITDSNIEFCKRINNLEFRGDTKIIVITEDGEVLEYARQ